MNSGKDILIIGAGVNGLFSAYYLLQDGHRVTVLDQSDLSGGCSYGNLGMIVPSHFVPLAAPGMISQGIRWMLRRDSPFYVRLRPNPSLARWGWAFYRSSNELQVEKAMPALRDISLLSRGLFSRLVSNQELDFGLEEKGLLMICRTEKMAEEESKTARLAAPLGIVAKVLSREQIQRMEPDLQPEIIAGVYYPGDAHCNPGKLMEGLKSRIISLGGSLVPSTRVLGFRQKGNQVISVLAENAEIPCEQIVLCAGSWSAKLARDLGIRVPLQPGKGYSMTVDAGKLPAHYPLILSDDRVAITPMGPITRFGGTMEIGSSDSKIDPRRVSGITKALHKYFPQLEFEGLENIQVWSGLRPCTPDGLPYIGRVKRYSNLVLATGHAMMGLSLGPATGQLVADLVAGRTPSINLKLFSPERFG